MNSRLKLLITGGRGRIAGLLGPMLGQRGFEVQRASRIADERFVDYRELVSPATLASFDTVLHLAWSTVPATAEQLPGSEWEVDLPYLARLLRTTSYALVGTNRSNDYKAQMGEAITKLGFDEQLEQSAKEIGRLEARLLSARARAAATVEDVAWWYVFLASDRAGYSTGSVFTVDGGLDAQQMAVRPVTEAEKH